MLQIYDVCAYLDVDDKNDWIKLGDTGWACQDDSTSKEQSLRIENQTFHDAYNALMETPMEKIWADKTLFTRRPYIRVVTGWCGDQCMKFFPNKFQSLTYKIVYEQRKYVSIEWIIKHLSVEKAAQYFKERGIAVCPISSK